MAYPTTCAGWVTYVQDFLDVGDYSTAQVQGFIDEAHEVLNRDLNSYWMEKETTYTTLASGTKINLLANIADFNRIKLVNLLGLYPLDTMSYNEMKALIADATKGIVGIAETSKNFCIFAGQLYVFPWPPTGTVIEIGYYMKVPSLKIGTTETNVFTVNHPDILLMASCVAAAPYMSEDERVTMWQASYNMKRDAINNVSQSAKLGSTPLKRILKVMR